MQIEEIQLATNETILDMIKAYKEICKKHRYITYATLSVIIIQNIILVLNRVL